MGPPAALQVSTNNEKCSSVHLQALALLEQTEGADHFFVVPHDFGACFHYQVIKLEFRTSELFFFHTVFPSHLLQFASRIIRLMRIKKQLMFRKRRLSIEESFRCFAVLRWSRLSGRRTMSASRKGLSPSHHTLLHRK
jgi:hypothetical protein